MGMAGTPDDSPLTLADVEASEEYRDLETPKIDVGDRAVDFLLAGPHDQASALRLSHFAENRPVALIFGSFT